MVEFRKPSIHSSRNSNVKCASFNANFSEIVLINMVLFDGIQRPEDSSNCPSIRKSNV
jgi:hypothetical protein